ncbi:hypothetical protein PINS_up007116 [Pythium insidiosum]|nr:hypothetical protein PINS_up007116 [Pythium insidiosum]
MSTASSDLLLPRGGNGVFIGGSSASSLASNMPRGGGGGGGGVSVRETSSLLGDDYAYDAQDDTAYYELQLFAYRLIYVFQGAFFGLLGPSLSFFSTLALTKSDLHSPVSSFGPIFAAHGGAALVMSFMSELVLNVAIEMELMKYLMAGLLVCSGAWYACLPAVAGATGSLGVSVYFIAKGVWTALINISLNRCCLWIAGDKIEDGRSLVTAMNFAYGFGTMLGPLIAWALSALALDLSYAYYALGALQVVPLGVLLVLPNPRPLYGRDHHQSLLGFEDPTRRVPTVPSPIVGGVFLHVKHYGGSANCNPDTYDPLNNFIILLVTIFATVLFGIQLGLGAFLFDYIGHVLARRRTRCRTRASTRGAACSRRSSGRRCGSRTSSSPSTCSTRSTSSRSSTSRSSAWSRRSAFSLAPRRALRVLCSRSCSSRLRSRRCSRSASTASRASSTSS